MTPDMHPALRRAIIAARSATVPIREIRVMTMPVPIKPAYVPPPSSPDGKIMACAQRVDRHCFVGKRAALIIRATSRATGISITDIIGPRRLPALVAARWIAIYLCRIDTEKSFHEIGKEFGGRNHHTIMYAVAQIEARVAADLEFAARVEAIRGSINA